MSKKPRKKKKYNPKVKQHKQPTGNIELADVVETADWGTLSEIAKDTLDNTIRQYALVTELRKQNESKLTDELNQAFDGLELSFKDLISETLKLGLRHATKVEKRTGDNGVVVEFPVMLKTGLVNADMDDDAGMEYLNIASAYMSIQDKTVNLVSLGWVDLFTRLKLPLDQIKNTVKDGIDLVKDANQELTKNIN